MMPVGGGLAELPKKLSVERSRKKGETETHLRRITLASTDRGKRQPTVAKVQTQNPPSLKVRSTSKDCSTRLS